MTRPARPLVVEIFPRLLTRAVVKSCAQARSRYLADHALPPDLRALAGNRPRTCMRQVRERCAPGYAALRTGPMAASSAPGS